MGRSKMPEGDLKDLLRLVYYFPKGKCKYSTSTLRFALQLRHSSNAAYNLLSHYLPLPSKRLYVV